MSMSQRNDDPSERTLSRHAWGVGVSDDVEEDLVDPPESGLGDQGKQVG